MASLSHLSVSLDQLSIPFVLRSSNPYLDCQRISLKLPTIFGSELKSTEIEQPHLRLSFIFKNSLCLKTKASMKSGGMTQELENSKIERVEEGESGSDSFEQMKHRFLSFKKHKYMKKLDHYQSLANAQAPKFMVIACADSRVCPSAILGFQPGEAFTVRNVANLAPPFESGPSETKAALEFSVNFLNVENILVIGHSCCGGIRALMSMEDEEGSSSFIKNWVVFGQNARLSTKAAASNLSFDEQCKHCEKQTPFWLFHNIIKEYDSTTIYIAGGKW